MKTVIALSLAAVSALAFACNSHKDTNEPVDTTRTTSAIVADPTLHESHAAEPNTGVTPMTPNNVDVDPNADQNQDEDMDVDQTDMSGVRDGG